MLLNVNKSLKITLSYSPLLRISSDYKKPYLFSNRMLHKNSVLHANNPAGFNLGQGQSNPLTTFPLNQEAESILLQNLNKIRGESQSMNGFEFLKEIESNFERSIPASPPAGMLGCWHSWRAGVLVGTDRCMRGGILTK